MKKLLTTILAAAMMLSAAIPVLAADPEVAVAQSGDKTLTGVTANGSWDITDDAITSTGKDNNFLFTNDTADAGKITVTIDRTSASSTGHDGIMFCISDDSTKLWEREVDSYYFMFVEGGGTKIGLAKSGDGFGGWATGDFPNRYVIPEEDQTGVFTLSAEWDGTGTINAYLNGEKVFTWNDPNPLCGNRYGIRAASTGAKFTNYVVESAELSADAVRNGKVEAIPGEVVVDGIIDDAWEKAPVYVMENEVSDDCRGDVATRKDSSTVKFRVMYSGNKVYMLVEVEDDAWATGSNTNWRNDSLMIYVSENGSYRNTKNDNRYCMVAYLENYDANMPNWTGFYTRSGNGTNDKAKEHAVVKDGTKAVMELSFELNNETPVEGGQIAFDLQYNDQDLDPATAAEQSRTVVWAWSCSDPTGPNNVRSGAKGWGDVYFVAAPVCEHTNTEIVGAKEATETEEGYTGDTVCKDCGEIVIEGENIPVKEPATTPDPVDPPKTGDAMLIVSVVAIVAAAGAVMIARRRKVTE